MQKSLLMLLMALTLVFTPEAKALEMEDEAPASRLQITGYGELHYNVPTDGGTSTMDLHRMNFGFSYELTDWITAYTEVDFEHSAQEMELEFAYLDFLISPALNFRTGSMLMPVGPLNEFHEPPLFYSVERPAVQKVIIPTTWQEGGIGIWGSLGEGLRYRLYLVSGLAGSGFRGKDGIRKGRGKVDGGETHPKTGEELAGVGRLEYSPMAGVDLGTSLYYGKVDQNNVTMAGDPSVSIYEGDVRIRQSGFDFQALYAKIKVNEADNISRATCKADKGSFDGTGVFVQGDPSCETIGEEMVGWYIELAYHLENVMGWQWDLVPFIRISEFNTQDGVPTGLNGDNKTFSASGKNDQEITTVGLAYFPDPQVALKADVQKLKDAAGKDTEQYNFGMAYMF